MQNHNLIKLIKRLSCFLILMIGLFLSGCDQQNTPEKKTSSITVESAPVKLQHWQQQIQAVGTLAANQGIVLKSEVPGRVIKIFFQSGDFVKKGMPLIELNHDVLKAQLASAEAQLTLSQSTYQRMTKLVKRNAAAKSEFDKARANLNSDTANVALIKAKLEQMIIKAPFSGHLGLRLVNLGDYISAGQALVNLQDDRLMRVDFSVPEVYLSELRKGDHINLHAKAFPHKTFTGKVYALDSVVDAHTRSINVRATIPNKHHQLIPGTFAEVKIFVGKKHNVLTIPQTAVIYAAESNYVYRVSDGHAIKANVSLGQRRGDQVVIKKGLKLGDEVITSGQLKIANGSLVKSNSQKVIA